jgi:hypothetical protein
VRFTLFNIAMSGRLFHCSLSRYISDVSREIQMITGPHFPSPAPEIRSMSTFHLPDVPALAQCFIDMGLRPALACRLSNIYVDFVARYRQVFESYFRRAIQGNCDLHLERYRDIFVVQFKGTIQILGSQFMSAIWVWLCQARLPTLFSPQCIDVKITIFYYCFTKLMDLFGLDTRGFRNESSHSFETRLRNNIVHYRCGWFKFYLFF